MPDDKGQPAKLWITSSRHVHSGTNKRGDDYSIFEIEALREDKTPITDKKLRSFEDLPTGELLDLTVTRFESEKHGTSWTLSRKGKGAHQRISDLGERVAALEQWRTEVVGAAQTQARTDDLDQRFGAEAPY